MRRMAASFSPKKVATRASRASAAATRDSRPASSGSIAAGTDEVWRAHGRCAAADRGTGRRRRGSATENDEVLILEKRQLAIDLEAGGGGLVQEVLARDAMVLRGANRR